MTTEVSEADARFKRWMRDNLDRAAEHFGVVITGDPLIGWMDRSISAPVREGDSDRWLRVVSEDKQWTGGDFWTGNLDANSFAGLAKPHVLDVFEWEEWRQQRAEIMTRVPGSTCSPTDVLRAGISLDDMWWEELRRTTDTIAATPTKRVNSDQDKVTERLTKQFGDAVDPIVAEWETVHGDVHWANLVRPRFGLLDWELWGRGPKGADAATLLCHSLLVPGTARRVREVYADVLETETGRIAQLYVAARLLRRIRGGDYPDLLEPLELHVRGLLGS
ncbi:aminoglycoside phosphotransferase [Actinosynnema mirum]|uniref:Aminoglycoside phosphotransferase n=1 Tax=Actinosynnema mirum (strain ATCC 29888 / DSM 43827 / JCM 3225 / NBRC 14064 / NCIMB 13271 / NRRL B-12336 / IMRU 3971 / 101) TaxID=446462 RepID=C6WMC4_ACTMD|nr:aminoglycoside phosphotransferase [Actinosynnema mirum]ACU34858.1 aminoglycoside phosphotransferase [Actinosynnema mirum DSM 43827]